MTSVIMTPSGYEKFCEKRITTGTSKHMARVLDSTKRQNENKLLSLDGKFIVYFTCISPW